MAEPRSDRPTRPAQADAAAPSSPLGEVEVIRLAGSYAPEAAAARAAAETAQAERITAGLYPNPSLGWDREHRPGGDLEDALVVTVPIDLTPVRRARVGLARAEAATARAEAARIRGRAVSRAVQLYYELLADEQRVAIAERAAARLGRAAEIVKRRRQAGDAAGYDQTRIEIAAEMAASELRQGRTRAERLRIQLALLLGIVDGRATFAGSLVPDSALAAGLAATPSDAVAELSGRPSLALLRSARDHADAARGDADRWWIPVLSLSGGLRRVSADETRLGYAAGLSVELPVTARGQGLRAEAEAHRREVAARVHVYEQSMRRDAIRAGRALASARAERVRFEQAIGDRVERLERAAETGYREGQRSIVELLDAGRAHTAVE
ncbi:MAG: TolC family protein, partial [Myxococcota bacterium]